MNAHTPGPWKKAERLNGPWWHISSGQQAVANVCGESKRGAKAYAEMFEANARLIAAAPDLLEVLQELLPTLEDQRIDAKAQAAIAKATGGAA